jgi:hypothetical protein
MSSEQYPSSSSPEGSQKTLGPPGPPEAQRSAIQLYGSVLPLAEKTLSSDRITYAYILLSLTIRFPAGCDNMVLAYPLIALDPYISTSGVPPGTNLLSQSTPYPYIVGDNLTLQIPTGRIVVQRGTYLKVHIKNTDSFTHTLTTVFTLQEYTQD